MGGGGAARAPTWFSRYLTAPGSQHAGSTPDGTRPARRPTGAGHDRGADQTGRAEPRRAGTTPRTRSGHPLGTMLRDAARRSLPMADGTIAVCPALTGPCDAVVVCSGFTIVAADVPTAWVLQRVPRGPGGALSPGFLGALADRLGVPAPEVNVLLAARKPPQARARAALRPSDRSPADWAAYRSDIHCYADPDGTGVITLGRGPGQRLDLSVELEGARRPWLRASTVVAGRELLEAARTVATDDLFASVPAWDAAALRTYLCGGFRAIGAEALFGTRTTPTWFP